MSDRRTAAVIAAGGTVRWFCLPVFDGEPLLADLLDAERGGTFRHGPEKRIFGRQSYLEDTPGLLTRSVLGGEAALELTDVMAWPGDSRGSGG